MKTGNNPLVSVIIPVYNCERYVAEAIDSVLSQTYNPIEIIVIDDGSTDGGADVVKRFGSKLKYEFRSNAGADAARNRGFDLAQGPFVAFLDADDLWIKNKLALQMDAFNKDPQIDVVFGHTKQFHSPDMDEEFKRKVLCPPDLMPGYVPSTMLVKRESFLKVGYFQTKRQVGEIISWYALAKEHSLRMLMLCDLVSLRRLHGTNLGIRHTKAASDYAHILKAVIDRKRQKMQK